MEGQTAQNSGTQEIQYSGHSFHSTYIMAIVYCLDQKYLQPEKVMTQLITLTHMFSTLEHLVFIAVRVNYLILNSILDSFALTCLGPSCMQWSLELADKCVLKVQWHGFLAVVMQHSQCPWH